MKTKLNLNTTIAAGLLLALSATANAGAVFPTVASESKIKACVAAVNDGANLEEARRVRHEVDSQKRRGIGHKLFIDTRVYGDVGILREYRAVCVVTGDPEPASFEIVEVETHS